MAKTVPYLAQQNRILSELVKAARRGKTITYLQLGMAVGIPTRGPWKPILDRLSLQETNAGRPDVTFMVVRARTGYPGQIGFTPANPPSQKQKSDADKILKDVSFLHNTLSEVIFPAPGGCTQLGQAGAVL